MAFMFGELPEEFRQMLDRQHLENRVTQQEVDRLLEELPIEQLLTVRTIIRTASQSAVALGFFDGVIYTRLRREGRCTSCGGPDHDHEEFEQLLLQESGNDEEAGSSEPLIDGTHFTAEEHRLMAEYNLDDLRDEDTHELLGFVCLGCGMRYPSLQDRMMRAPDECSGCFRKSAHG
jgi:hypothetical protein